MIFREYRIKRKIQHQVKKIKKMADSDRQALLTAIGEIWPWPEKSNEIKKLNDRILELEGMVATSGHRAIQLLVEGKENAKSFKDELARKDHEIKTLKRKYEMLKGLFDSLEEPNMGESESKD